MDIHKRTSKIKTKPCIPASSGSMTPYIFVCYRMHSRSEVESLPAQVAESGYIVTKQTKSRNFFVSPSYLPKAMIFDAILCNICHVSLWRPLGRGGQSIICHLPFPCRSAVYRVPPKYLSLDFEFPPTNCNPGFKSS